MSCELFRPLMVCKTSRDLFSKRVRGPSSLKRRARIIMRRHVVITFITAATAFAYPDSTTVALPSFFLQTTLS